MALRNDIDDTQTSSGNPTATASCPEPIPVTKAMGHAIAAIFQHFGSMDDVVDVRVFKDDESGLTFDEVNSTLQDDAYERLLDESWVWWRDQPETWRKMVHLGLW
jgi:hypothetical protein